MANNILFAGDTKQNRYRQVYVAGVVILLLVILVINYGLNRVERQVRLHTINGLKTVLNSSHYAISRVWLNNLYLDAAEAVSEQGVIQYIKLLNAVRHDAGKLKNHPAREALKKHFKKFLTHLNGNGVELISPDYINLLSSKDICLVSKQLLTLITLLSLPRYLPDCLSLCHLCMPIIMKKKPMKWR